MSRPRHGLDRAVACSIAGFVFFVFSLLYPFLALSSSGVANAMTLPQAVVTIYQNQSPALAVIFSVAVLVAPLVLLLSLVALSMPVLLEKPVPWLRLAGRMVFTLKDWNMVEVFVIAVLVSLVKIAHLADVIIGLSFWSYTMLMFCVTGALSGLDRLQVWRKIEVLSQ